MTPVITYPDYFEFLLEFVKFYEKVLHNFILDILQTLINRVLAEHGKLAADPSLTLPRVVILKSWNIIKLVCERTEYMSKFNQLIEEKLKQLYVFMIDPTQIIFEDEIVANLKQLIRRNKQVSSVQWEMLEMFPKVLSKNKDAFGNLLDTLNYYLTMGRSQLISTHQQHIQTIAQMADTALFTQKPNVVIKNTEGSILIQILLQIMQGTGVCNEFFESLLNRVR